MSEETQRKQQTQYIWHAVRCASYDTVNPVEKLSISPFHSNSAKDYHSIERNGATKERFTVPSTNESRHTLSTDCLPATTEYCTSAKVVDHFLQKIRTPSTSTLSSSHSSQTASVNRPNSSREEILSSSKAPVATIDDLQSEESNSNNTSRSGSVTDSSRPILRRSQSVSGESTSQSNDEVGNETSPKTIRFLPAYRSKTPEQMMQDRSPRATWQKSTNKSVHRSQSSRSPHMPSSLGYYNNVRPNQHSRIYGTPSPQRPPYGSIRNRPNVVNPRAYDGNHPRMPMRAVQPQTFHGRPVQMGHPHTQQHGSSTASPYASTSSYGTVRRGMPVYGDNPPATMNYSQKAHSQGDMRNNRGRIYSDSSSNNQSPGDGSIRGANSEADMEHPRTMPRQPGRAYFRNSNSSYQIPSGQYVASSSMTSLPQYAQLMPPGSPKRVDSAESIRRPTALAIQPDVGTRHSYSIGAHFDRPQSNTSNQRVTSYDDVFSGSKTLHKGNITPTSPVSRQPSYLTAMSAPIRQRSIPGHGAIHETAGHDYPDNGEVIRRSKASQQTDEDFNQKILRRTSYLMATSKPDFSVDETHKTPNQKYRKLKKFFGEGTPSIKEAQEKALQNSSSQTPEPFTLPDNLEVQKTGILGVKVVTIEGKRSNSRSWRGMGAVLSRDMLYLVKDKKENATMLTTPSGSLTIDEKPVSIIACYVAIDHSYTKRRHVFKLITSTASEYLFQAENDKDMVDWVKAIEANRHPDKESEQLTSAELVKRINNQQNKLNQQKRRTLGGLSFKSKQPYNSPSTKSGESSQKKDKKSKSGPSKQLQYTGFNNEPPSGDFGAPLHECVPSHENEFIPLVVELCTKAIEDRGLDFVGIYRVPGNKAAVELLKKELKEGIINLENDKWKDMNVLSSLLKTFFRRLPDSLITSERYKEFILTNRLSDPKDRLIALKRLIGNLPDYNFETLKYLAIHLRKVAEHGDVNKMDTRNLAIVFGPTIVKSGDDVMSLVTDMSDQCRIIESLIIYCDWIFSESISDPPTLDEADVSPSCAPISETMNNMSADIAMLANNKNKSSAQLMSAFSSAINKNISKSSIQQPQSPPTLSVTPHRDPSSNAEDDHGFKNRDLQQESAARNQKLHGTKERESRENMAWHPPSPCNNVQSPTHNFVHSEAYTHYPSPHHQIQLPRWRSEESVLAAAEHHQRITHDQYPYHSDYKPHNLHPSSSDRLSDGTPPPPLPARGMSDLDSKPPLPPKPMQLHHAKPTHIEDFQNTYTNQLPGQIYGNYEQLQLKVCDAAVHHRTLRVMQSQLKSSNLPRRGSLDSMMDTLESFNQCSSSSSTESQVDGTDMLSSITATFDQKLKLLVDPKYQPDGQEVRKPKLSSDSSSMGSSLRSQRGAPDSPSAPHNYRCSSDQSRESLLSILSNKENMHTCDSFSSAIDIRSSDRGFDGSTSSVGSAPRRPETKVGIASRIERTDIKPMALGYAPAANHSVARVVSATGSVVSQKTSMIGSNDNGGDFTNNNNLALDYDEAPMVQRNMSDEKKRIRRRHTVGGAQDFELFNSVLSDYKTKQSIMNETNSSPNPQPDSLSAWQRLQPRDVREPLSLRDWIERERCRASSPELEMHTTQNIMHLQTVNRRLPASLLESNT